MSLTTRAPICRTEPPAGYTWIPAPFDVVMPYCARDAHRALDTLQWMEELHGKLLTTLTLVMDDLHQKFEKDPVVIQAKRVFETVRVCPVRPTRANWPGCNNHVFNHIVRVMGERGRPWLLLETDMVPITPDWLFVLEKEYNTAKKPFMGAWVEGFDIINGGGVYPPDTAPWIPKYLSQDPLKAIAYDCAIAPEIIWFSHNASHLMPHVWTERANGRPSLNGQKPPTWTPRMAEWVLTHNAVPAHRCKTGALIQILRDKNAKPVDEPVADS